MKHLTAAALLLSFASAASVASAAPGAHGASGAQPPRESIPAASANARRSIVYFANYPHDPTLPANLAMLVDASEKGYLTHVVLGLFHLDWIDWTNRRGNAISLNGTPLDDPRMRTIWEAVKVIQSRGVKVIASFGGDGTKVKDFRQLLDWNHPEWYPPLRAALRDHRLDGIDLDIEEDDDGEVMNTAHVKKLVRRLRRDLGRDFIVTAAPVASALSAGSSGSMSPHIDYIQLIEDGVFDWYHLQFYNDWGDLVPDAARPATRTRPDYDLVLESNPTVSPSRFVAGVPTCAEAGGNYHALAELQRKVADLSARHRRFGGVFGWIFTSAVAGGRVDPVGWTRGVSDALKGRIAAGATARRSTLATKPLYTFQALGEEQALPMAVNANGDVAGWLQKLQHAFVARAGSTLVDLQPRPEDGSGQATAITTAGDVIGWRPVGHATEGFFASATCNGVACWRGLGTLGGNHTEVWGANDTQAVGWSRAADRTPHAFVRDLAENGVMHSAGTLGGLAGQASAISSSGAIAGWAQQEGGAWRAFLKEPAQAMTPLLPSLVAQATAVSTDTTGLTRTAGWALGILGFEAWLQVDGTPWRFGTLAGAQSAATAVNARGEVVGWYLDEDGLCRAFRLDAATWQGVPRDLEEVTSGIPQGDGLLIATAVNERGQIAGQTRAGRAFLLTPMTP